METVLRGQAWPGTHYPQCNSMQLCNAIKKTFCSITVCFLYIILPPQGGRTERLSEWVKYGQTEDKREMMNRNGEPHKIYTLYSTCPDSSGCKISYSWKQSHKLLIIIHETAVCWQHGDILLRKLQRHNGRLIIPLSTIQKTISHFVCELEGVAELQSIY